MATSYGNAPRLSLFAGAARLGHRVPRAAFAILLPVLAGSALAQNREPQRFESATAGIALARPAGWRTASLQMVEQNRARVRLSDGELEAAMQRAATAPLFAFIKHPEPYPDINPTIQITVRPLGTLAGSRPTEIMTVAVGVLQKALSDVAFVTAVTDVQVSGLPAAYMRASYTMKNAEGQEFKVLTRMWLVPRGAFAFLIGMSGPQEGPDMSDAEFAAALASISIQR